MSTDILKTGSRISFDEIAAEAEIELEVEPQTYREKFIQLAMRCYAHLNIFNSNHIEVDYFEMNSTTGIVDLSSLTDFIDYVKIGMPINGKIWILDINNKILLPRDTLSEDAANKIFNNNDSDILVQCGYYFCDHYCNGNFISGLYGVGGGFSRSYCRVDKENMQIQFDTSVPNNEIVLEYISTGIKASGATLVPVECKELLVAWIVWKHYMPKRNIYPTEKRDYKQEYLERERELRSFQKKWTLQEYTNALYSTFRATAKR